MADYTSTFGITPYPPTDDKVKRRQFYDDYLQQKYPRPDLGMKEGESLDDYLQRTIVNPLSAAGAEKTGSAIATVPSVMGEPWEPGVKAQTAIDEWLTGNVVEPAAKLGFPNVGAALATVPSTLSDAVIPQSGLDLATTIIPMPAVAKAMKDDGRKFKKIKDAMKAEEKIGAARPAADIIEDLASRGQEKEFKPDPYKPAIKEFEPDPSDIQKIEREGDWTKQIKESWTDIDPKGSYKFEDEIISGKELKDRLLDMSTGDFHTAKWEKVKPDLRLVGTNKPKIDDVSDDEIRNLRIKNSLSKIDQLMQELKKAKEVKPDLRLAEPPKPIESPKPQKIDTPKGPKGDPEASLQFQKIRDSLNVAPSRYVVAGRDASGKVGSYSFTPDEASPMPQFEDVVKRNYNERDFDQVEKTITKVLADPQMADLTPQQKQALADFVRYRYGSNKNMAKEAAFADMLGLKDDPGSIAGLSGKNRADYDMLRQMHKTNDDLYGKAYDDLAKAFGSDQGSIRGRDPRVQKMYDILHEDQPFGRGDTPTESAQELGRRMYAGRPSAEAEAEKYGKIKEAISKKSTEIDDFNVKSVSEAAKILENDSEYQKIMKDLKLNSNKYFDTYRPLPANKINEGEAIERELVKKAEEREKQLGIGKKNGWPYIIRKK